MTGPEMGPTEDKDNATIQQYYEWCADNKLDEYIDYMSPVYRLGRMRIGEMTNDLNISDIQTMAIEYPSIKEIMLINDK